MDETRNGRANDGRLRVARARGADCGRRRWGVGCDDAMMREMECVGGFDRFIFVYVWEECLYV